jgi:cell division septum initiation protein DivIVA
MDRSLRRVDELLTELVELVETARTLPMSSSCVLPRERLLDLLDELREVVPSAVENARQVLDQRDAVLTEAREAAGHVVAQAEQRGRELTAVAQAAAAEAVESGRREHARLVAADTVHLAAADEAAKLRAEAAQYASGLRRDALAYADRTLAELLDVLRRTETTAEQGRVVLATRATGSGT